jgi:hypothetical protein
MRPPFIHRPGRKAGHRRPERGVTIALVAAGIFSIIAMAALSIDVGTLYQASAEAQRAADAGALAGARFISMSGITGNTSLAAFWVEICGGPTSPASLVAIAVAQQNTVAGTTIPAPAVTYSVAGSALSPDCTTLTDAFAVNPLVTVKVTQSSLPTYFSRIWGRTGSSVSATATAEVFNPSNSGSYTASGNLVPVRPRCVKPWIVPNLDPGNLPGVCTGGGCPPFVKNANGSIQNPGIINSGTGVIGETFNLVPDCGSNPGTCKVTSDIPTDPPGVSPVGSLQYVPGQVLGSPVAVPSCATANTYQQAVAGCDQSTPYQCGVPWGSLSSPNQVDLTENPGIASGDTSTAAQCLIHQSGTTGQDTLLTTGYPYQIQAGAGNSLNVSSTTVITSSNSIVSLPIYDSTNSLVITGNDANVTIVGFLQVFINSVDTTTNGNMNVTVLNVSGCGNAVPSGTVALQGTSPVPVRLITPP